MQRESRQRELGDDQRVMRAKQPRSITKWNVGLVFATARLNAEYTLWAV